MLASMLGLASVVAGGCASEIADHELGAVRSRLLDLIDQQAMDNLVRARRGEPMLHIDDAEVKGTGKWSLSLIASDTDGDTQALTTNSDADKLVLTGTEGFSLGGSATAAMDMAVTGKPVYDSRRLYARYRAFASSDIRVTRDESETVGALRVVSRPSLPDGHDAAVPDTVTYYSVENTPLARERYAALVMDTMTHAVDDQPAAQ